MGNDNAECYTPPPILTYYILRCSFEYADRDMPSEGSRGAISLPVSPDNDGVWYVGRHPQWGFEYLSLLETVLEMAMERNPSSILDFGCGDGRLLYELAKRSWKNELGLWGVDVDERALLFARAFNRGRPVNFARNVGKLSGRKFELLVASEVLEHIPGRRMSRFGV